MSQREHTKGGKHYFINFKANTHYTCYLTHSFFEGGGGWMKTPKHQVGGGPIFKKNHHRKIVWEMKEKIQNL